jgi:transposase
MMGRQRVGQKQLFYSFNLDDNVPSDHLLRGIDQFLDLGDLHPHLAPFYSHTGRPSIDPQLLIRMLIVGYCFGIRSERRLCEEVYLNLAYRWFCRLGLEDQVPDHSTFSKNWHGRFRDSDTLRFVFEQVLERCVREGLVGGEGFAIDASFVKADANRQRGVPGGEAIWSDRQSISRPVREYLTALAGGWPQNPPSPTPVDREEKGVYSSYPQTVKNFAGSRAVLMLPGAAFRRWRSAWEQDFVEAVFPEGATPLRRAARDRRHAQASGLSGMCVWRDLKKDPVCPPYSKYSPTAQNG